MLDFGYRGIVVATLGPANHWIYHWNAEITVTSLAEQ